MSTFKKISLVLLLIILIITYKYFVFDATRLVRVGSNNSISQLNRKNIKVRNKINGIEYVFNEDTYEFDFPTCSFKLIIDTLFSKKIMNIKITTPGMELTDLTIDNILIMNDNKLYNPESSKSVLYNNDSIRKILLMRDNKYSGFFIEFTYKNKPKTDFPLFINYIYQNKFYTDTIYFDYSKVIFNSNPFNVFMFFNYLDEEFK